MPAQTLFTIAGAYGTSSTGTLDTTNGHVDSAFIINEQSVGCETTNISVEVEKTYRDIKNQCTGQIDKKLLTAAYTLKVSMNKYDANKLAQNINATVNTVAAGTVSDETVQTTEVGGIFRTKMMHVTVGSEVITDSTATPVTLIKGTHYQLANASDTSYGHGKFELLSVTGLTLPLKIAYAHGAYLSLTPALGTVRTSYTWDGVIEEDGVRHDVRFCAPDVEWEGDGALTLLGSDDGSMSLSGAIKKVLALDGVAGWEGGLYKLDGLPA